MVLGVDGLPNLTSVTPLSADTSRHPCQIPLTERRRWPSVVVAGTVHLILPQVALTTCSFLERGVFEDHIGHVVHDERIPQWCALLWMEWFGDFDLFDTARYGTVEHENLSSGNEGYEPGDHVEERNELTSSLHGVETITTQNFTSSLLGTLFLRN